MSADLKNPEKLILNSLSLGPFPSDSLFQQESEYRYLFGEEWHGLDANECWLAIARLVSLGLVAIKRVADLKRSVPGHIRDMVYISLTELGGGAWEEAFQVQWEHFIRDEAGPDEMGSGESRYSFRAMDRKVLANLQDEIGAGEFAEFFLMSQISSDGAWKCTNWKSFEHSYSFVVAVKKTESIFPDRLSLERHLFKTKDRVSAGFKRRLD